MSFGGHATGRASFASSNTSDPFRRGRPSCRTVFCALHDKEKGKKQGGNGNKFERWVWHEMM